MPTEMQWVAIGQDLTAPHSQKAAVVEEIDSLIKQCR